MKLETINEICELTGNIRKNEAKVNDLIKEIKDEFFSHPQWSMFLERHGAKGFSDNMGGDQYYDFTFFDDGTCTINCRDIFRGELVEDVDTRNFKASELIEFLSNKNYYGPLLERFQHLIECRKEALKNERESQEYKLYQKLKQKYEKP